MSQQGTLVATPAPAPEAPLVMAPANNFEGIRCAFEQIELLKAERGWKIDFDRQADTLYFRGPNQGPAISYFVPGQPEVIMRLDAASGRLTGVDLERFRAVLAKSDEGFDRLYRLYVVTRLLRRVPFLASLLNAVLRGLQALAGDTVESAAAPRDGHPAV